MTSITDIPPHAPGLRIGLFGGSFNPADFFASGGPLLLGCLPLGELIKGVTGIKVLQVPYKGAAPALALPWPSAVSFSSTTSASRTACTA